ncbi:MAG: SDR family oxidoreductase [Chlorobiota bacterium]
MKAIVIGATGTIGKGIVNRLEKEGYEVIAASRNGEHKIDINDPNSVNAFFANIDSVDAVVCAAGSAAFTPISEIDEEKLQLSFNSKLGGQIRVAQKALEKLNENGAVILTGGMFAYDPWPSTSVLAAVNKGLEGFALGATKDIEDGRRVIVSHPPLLSETAERMEMDKTPWPNTDKVSDMYWNAIGNAKNGDVVYLEGYEPK